MPVVEAGTEIFWAGSVWPPDVASTRYAGLARAHLVLARVAPLLLVRADGVVEKQRAAEGVVRGWRGGEYEGELLVSSIPFPDAFGLACRVFGAAPRVAGTVPWADPEMGKKHVLEVWAPETVTWETCLEGVRGFGDALRGEFVFSVPRVRDLATMWPRA